jgi:hypothetical protein
MQSIHPKTRTMGLLVIAAACAAAGQLAQAQPRTLSAALARGDASGSFYLRYEAVDEDNALKNAKALTLRSALKYTTGTLNGFSGVLEAEDVRIVGVGDYSVPASGYNVGQYSVINDPETTELNQSYLQYANGRFTGRIGRQDLRYDNQRFIGAVPWRQDYQTFDAVTLEYKNEAALTIAYHYLMQRERIFAQDADIDSKDHLLHAIYPTPLGSLTGYAYLLQDDIPLDNKLDTYGLRLSGAKKAGPFDATYLLEYATQDYTRGPADFSADYYTLEGALTMRGITGRIGFESLGSDGGAYGFGTPLATVHAFQGWADQFVNTPNQGIEDLYFGVGAAVLGGSFTAVYHQYEADESTATIDDLGDEINLQWTLPFKNNYTFGLKYADYRQGDIAAKVDKQIFWTWLQMTF